MSAEKTAAPAEASSGYFPGWIGRLVIAVTLSFVVLIRVLGRTNDPPVPLNDPAVCNLLTLVFSFVAALTAWLWLCFRSALPLPVRRTVFIATLVLIAAGLITLRVAGLNRFIHFSGSMVPQWNRAAKELGSLEVTPAEPIDLTTTTDHDFPQFLGPERTCWIPGPGLSHEWPAGQPK